MTLLYKHEIMMPVFLPEALVSLQVPIEIFEKGMKGFNQRLEEEGGMKIEGKWWGTDAIAVGLQKIDDDLFLKWNLPQHYVQRAQRIQAKLLGYVLLDKKTGAVDSLVIEGFRFEHILAENESLVEQM